jgi:hypothetical protein
VHALHNIHRALTSDGILVDTQPVSGRPAVAADGIQLGSLDMREWAETIRTIDALVAQTIAVGLYDLGHEERFVVVDTFDSGEEFVEIAGEWRGTRVPKALAARALATNSPITVGQEVRLRVFRQG